MTPDAVMQKTDTISKDTMMKDNKIISGSWTPEETAAMEKEHMIIATGATMQKETPKMETSMAPHGYMDYSPELVASALQSGQKVILFFAASWCPSCKALNSSITSSISSIPADSLILRVDYDNSTALKQKYGVLTQHTTVVLNSDGTLASKKIGARTVAEVLGN